MKAFSKKNIMMSLLLIAAIIACAFTLRLYLNQKTNKVKPSHKNAKFIISDYIANY